jgi:hypothetical protein
MLTNIETLYYCGLNFVFAFKILADLIKCTEFASVSVEFCAGSIQIEGHRL